MSPRGQLETLARYNVWVTRRLWALVDTLTDEEYYRDVGLVFKSVHGTLYHLLVAEHGFWYKRFYECIHDGETPDTGVTSNDAVGLDRDQLKTMLSTCAERWLPLLESCSEATLTGMLRYTLSTGSQYEFPFVDTMSHVFNHGTHHRGQVTAAFTVMGKPCPELDLWFMLHEESAARATTM